MPVLRKAIADWKGQADPKAPTQAVSLRIFVMVFIRGCFQVLLEAQQALIDAVSLAMRCVEARGSGSRH